MKIRPKLTGAPMAYTMHLVDGTQDPFREFGENSRHDEQHEDQVQDIHAIAPCRRRPPLRK